MKTKWQPLVNKFQFAIEQILPSQCLLCHLSSNQTLICQYCHDSLAVARPCCLHCGLALSKTQYYCGDCLKQKHQFTQLHAVANYHPPYPALIKKFKYSKQLIFGELLADLLVSSIQSNILSTQLSMIDYLIPVPLHNNKLYLRGFNQAQLIAEKLSKHLNIPILSNTVIRSKETIAQETLSLSKRKKNLRQAFEINDISKHRIRNQHIVIIDDVVTTGATVNSLSKTLLQAGAKQIDIWCICRTSLPK
ncbi:ComF family protein [Psychromonas sp. PT13]|uniref:ComF family protein n=1 Tax=Psychromonas sp. PT13 TaxID=3439547 RepID=UPI003EBD12B2